MSHRSSREHIPHTVLAALGVLQPILTAVRDIAAHLNPFITHGTQDLLRKYYAGSWITFQLFLSVYLIPMRSFPRADAERLFWLRRDRSAGHSRSQVSDNWYSYR